MKPRIAIVLLVAALGLAGCPPPLPSGTVPGPDGAVGQHWLRFVQISDTQLADEESPARSVRTDGLISASWRPQEAYGVATLDAVLQAINAEHEAGKAIGRPVDCLVITGDICDLAGYNELRWFIDTMDGQRVDIDSGAADAAGRTPEGEDNPKLDYDAVGLSPEIPWYTVVGNHDTLATGNFPIDTSSNSPAFYSAPLLRPVAALIGLHEIDHHLNAFQPVLGKSPAVITGQGPAIDAETLQLDLGALRAGKIAPDNARRFLTRLDFIAEHFNSSTLPAGHGFTQENFDEDRAYYTVRPDPAVPVRFIVMDTVPPRIPSGYPAFYGVLTRAQFEDFVKPEIAAAQARGEFVVLFSHHSSDDFALPFPARKVNATEFQGYLAAQPNVIAHLCGHSHINRVHRIEGHYPYLEIETGAIIDYPQEGRVFDLFYDAPSGAVTLTAKMIGHMDAPTRLSAESYRRARIDALLGQGYETPDDAKYQALFTDAGKSWGLGDDVPREKTRRGALERLGAPEDRNVAVTLRRPAPDAWR